MSTCTFNDCNNQAIPGSVKCSFHKNRRQCKSKDCNNQVYARNLCVRHGGKKQCQYDGCDSYARGGNYCIQHGGIVVKRFCSVEGCTKQAHAKQLCVRHGGGRLCRTPGCQHHAREGGLCHKHNQVCKYEAKSPEKVVKSEVDTPHAVLPQEQPVIELSPLPLLSQLPVPDLASNASIYNKWLQLTQDVLWTLHPDLMGISYAGLMSTVQLPLPSLSTASPLSTQKTPAFDLTDSPKDIASLDSFIFNDSTFDILDTDLFSADDAFSMNSILA